MSCTVRKLFVGDIGTQIRVYSGITLTGATLIEFKAKRPDSKIVTWTASIDSDNPTYATYTTVSGDISLDGTWLLSLEVTFVSSGPFIGGTDKFDVFKQFED